MPKNETKQVVEIVLKNLFYNEFWCHGARVWKVKVDAVETR